MKSSFSAKPCCSAFFLPDLFSFNQRRRQPWCGLLATDTFLLALSALTLAVALQPSPALGTNIVASATCLPDSTIMVTWNYEPQRVYRLQFKGSPDDPIWLDVPGETIGCVYPPDATRTLLTTSWPQRYFRVVDLGHITEVPIGFQDANGDWLLSHRFLIGFTVPVTNGSFTTLSGYLLKPVQDIAWEVSDGPPTITPQIDQQTVFNDLMLDDRVAYVYPGRTDSTLQTPIFYSNDLLFQVMPGIDVSAFLAEQHLVLSAYFPTIDLYIARVTRKQDDPFRIAMDFSNDPRFIYIEISSYGGYRTDLCSRLGP